MLRSSSQLGLQDIGITIMFYSKFQSEVTSLEMLVSSESILQTWRAQYFSESFWFSFAAELPLFPY